MPAPALLLALLACALPAVTGCGSRPGPHRVATIAAVVVEPSTGSASAAGNRTNPDLAAVRQVARRYYVLLGGLRRRMRAAPLAQLMTPGCPCRDQARAVRRAARRGEHYTDRVHLQTLVAHLDRTDVADVFVSYDVIDGGLIDAHGHRVGTATTVRGVHRELMLRRIGGRWLIERVLAV